MTKNRTYFLILLVFLHLLAVGQKNAMDSLKMVLSKAQHDSTRCNALKAMIEIEANDSIWPLYNLKLLELAKTNSAKQDKLENLYLNHLSEAINNLGVLEYSSGNYSKALDFYFQSLKIKTEINDIIGRPNVLQNIAVAYEITGENLMSIDYYDKTVKAFEAVNRKAAIIPILHELAVLCNSIGDVSRATNYLFYSLRLAEETKDKTNTALTLQSIASIFESQGDTKNAIHYANKSISVYKLLGDKGGISTCLNLLGYIYSKLLLNDTLGLKYYLNALKLSEEAEDNLQTAICLNNIGMLYLRRKNSSEALSYLQLALKKYKELDDKSGISTSYSNISNYYLIQNDLKQALVFGQEGLKVAKEVGFPEKIMNSAAHLKRIYKKLDKYKEALELYSLEIKMKDSLNNAETQRSISRKLMQYNYEKMELQRTAEQQRRDIIANEEKQKQKIITYSIGVVLILTILLVLFIYRGLRQKHRDNMIITEQKYQVEQQKQLVELKHKEITDSINYAERIQRSFLASRDLLNSSLQNYFLLFKPKEAVSGDFYWAEELANGNFALVTADSTGHGVPGAIMSILNITCLEYAIKEGLTEPVDIFNCARSQIIERLKKDGSAEGGKDGMDSSILIFSPDKRKITYTGANNPVWIIREGKLLELEPDKMPVGRHEKEGSSFTQLEFELKPNDMIYTLTDGYPDQFGGPKGKKFMYKRLKDLLLNIASDNLQIQEEFLKQELEKWMGNNEQVDDITIIGIKI